MGIAKTLFYPFSIDGSYFDGYAWVIELSLRLKANLQLFTTSDGSDQSTDAIYQSLLAANGYYLHHFRHDSVRRSASLEQRIVPGDLIEEMPKQLKKNPVDLIVIDSSFYSRYNRELRTILKGSASAILLAPPSAIQQDSMPSITDHFYNNLRMAELNKIPANFYSQLGDDRSVFNYLRNYFQKNPA